jgi:hypothetical protein
VLSLLAAALAVVPAVVVGAAAPAAAAPPDDYPRGTTLYPGRLARGADTPLLHVQNEVIVDGDLRVPVRGIPHVWLLGKVGQDYVVHTAAADLAHYAVQLVHRDGSRQVLQRFGDRTTPVLSADGRRLALVTLAGQHTRIRVVKTRSGELVRSRTFATYGVTVADYGIRRMVLTGLRSRTYWWNPETGRLRLLVARPARADIAADRLVVWVGDPKVDPFDCQKTVVLSRPSKVLWRSCHDYPFAFSPDGRRMVSIFIHTDGIGPDVVQVRRQDGHVLHTYRARFFGFIEWENARQVLLQPVGPKYVAAVRCDVAAGCRRASRLYPAPPTMDPIESMRWSFP